MKFVPQANPTLGCEWELQLLRDDSLELADGILAFSEELGEHALIPTAPAILNAIRHACGARVTRLPALPHRVLAALRAAEETS